MKATSIEQIREHLARGGRVMCHFVRTECGEPEVNDVYGAASGDRIVVNYVDQMRVKFGDNRVDHWELLPIEEELTDEEVDAEIARLGIDMKPAFERLHKMIQAKRSVPIEDVKLDITQDEMIVGAYVNRIRKALLFGHYPSMNDLIDWWQATTGERIEWGRRCERCGGEGSNGSLSKTFIGLKPRYSPNAELVMENNDYFLAQSDGTMKRMCGNCNGSGYTVRPTWMGEVGK